MTSVEVDANGFVHAFFDTGISRTIYQIPLVDLPNPNGLVTLDSQTYLPSPESGSYSFGMPAMVRPVTSWPSHARNRQPMWRASLPT